MAWPMIVGLGSYNGDDRAGWLALERLQTLGYPQANLLNLSHPAKLLEKMRSDQSLVICDACVAGECVGNIRSLEWPSDKLTYERGTGSHDLSLNEILELARQLECSPPSVKVWTIEGGEWIAGSEPNSVIRTAANRVGDSIWESCCHA